MRDGDETAGGSGRAALAFGGSALDRAGHLRGDPAALAARLAAGRVLPLWRGKPLTAPGGLGYVPAGHLAPDMAAAPVFLGLDGGQAVFAADVSAWEPEGGPPPGDGFLDATEQRHPALPAGHVFAELRAIMARLSPPEAEMAATARALLGWHAAHGFCARCGARTAPAQAGWQRDCAACGQHHFPRTDPVVIMLVRRGNSLLLGRSPGWPEGMVSCLAGFVEPGETLEAAVRREVAEETGVAIGAVRVVASQPWPFPASLMIGCLAEGLSETIAIDPAEIAEALWVPREALVAVLAGTHPRLTAPRRGSIAQWLMEGWLAGRLG